LKEDIKSKVEEIIADFQSLDIYKFFVAAKNEIDNSERLNNLKKDIKEKKAQIKLLVNDKEKLKKHIAHIKELEEEYDNDPLVINYNYYKDELNLLVEPLRKMFEE